MTTRTVRFDFKYNSVLTDAASCVLSDQAGVYGVKRNDTSIVVVTDGTVMTKIATGQYEHTFTEPVGYAGAYTAWVESVYGGNTYYAEVDLAATEAAGSLATSYTTIKVALADYLGWGRNTEGTGSAWTAETLYRMDAIIKPGLNQVYYPVPTEPGGAVYQWSWMRPVSQLQTSEPYDTGTVTVVDGVVALTGVGAAFPSWAADGELWVNGRGYTVATRGGNTQLTLDNLDLDVDAGTEYQIARYRYELPGDFNGGDIGPMTYLPGQASLYPTIRHVPDVAIRSRRQQNTDLDRPTCFSIRPKTFDAAVGQRWYVIFDPTPDAEYDLECPYKVQPAMLSATNLYPLGGPDIGELVLQSCLAIAEQRYREGESSHTQLFLARLQAAVANDAQSFSPDTLGYMGDGPGREKQRRVGSGTELYPFNGVYYRD